MMQNENIRGNDNASMIIVKRRSSVNDTKSRINPNSTRRDEQESYVKCIKLSKSFFSIIYNITEVANYRVQIDVITIQSNPRAI